MGGRRVTPSGTASGALVGLAATLATAAVPYRGPVVRVSNECVPRDHPDCSGAVLAAGLPLYWVSDSPWVSAIGTLSPFGEDPVRGWALGADVAFWSAAFAVGARAWRRRADRAA